MTQWQFPSPIEISPDLLAYTGDALLAQLLTQRGIETVAQARGFLNPAEYQPALSTDLPDMDIAVSRLNQAIATRETICVWGDFDVDGQTSTALLVSMLQDLGGEVRYYIPNRLTESHGIKVEALNRLLSEGVDLLLTCDTGIAEHEAIAVAQAAGVDVIVTDHHDLDDTLPPAKAILNPKRLPASHPLHELPGVGVAYKLAQAMYQAHNRTAECESLLDLVALGIVADVAQQVGDTRYLLQQGLQVLQNTPRLGLHALLESANIKTDRLTETHIAFWLAPRLNALGRLGDANLGVELLTTSDLSRARIIALQLEALNDRRKILVDQVVVQALSQLEDTPSLADYNAIVLAGEAWHPGVIGIAASRVAEHSGKPAVLIALRPGGVGHGSARSVPGCDIHQAMKMQADLLLTFGGHPLAAGLSLAPENIMAFRRGLSAALEGCQQTTEKIVKLDVVVELPQVSAELLSSIQQLAPFGAGNPAIQVGCMGLTVLAEDTFGKGRSHKRLLVADEGGNEREILWWRGGGERTPRGTFDLAFTIGTDDYRGGDAIQLVWVAGREWQPTPDPEALEFIDWRREVDVLKRLSSLEAPQIWAEGKPGAPGLPRHQLGPATTLVIWSAPPGHDIFHEVIDLVGPQEIVLVGQALAPDTFQPFMQRLMGLVKYAISHKAGELYLTELAAALGHRETTVRLGLDWLAAQGRLAVTVEADDLLLAHTERQPPDLATVNLLAEMLSAALTETAAYRTFFSRASISALKR